MTQKTVPLASIPPELTPLFRLAEIRRRSQRLFHSIESSVSRYWQYVPAAWNICVEEVCQEIKNNYPHFNIPPHSRLRHFVVGQKDFFTEMQAASGLAEQEWLPHSIELVIISVLLDAGAGPTWTYTVEGNPRVSLQRSEGLAVASLFCYKNKLFGTNANGQAAVTKDGLERLSLKTFEQGFQVNTKNPLVGLEGRLTLIKSLASVMRGAEQEFPKAGTLGEIFLKLLRSRTEHDKAATAEQIMQSLHRLLLPIWPSRLERKGLNLGDSWEHAEAGGLNETLGIVSFHKLTQWLAYSLIDCLEQFGYRIDGQEELTALPEYRNGGLLIDTGVLRWKSKDQPQMTPLPVSHPAIVEWRAATICLIDRLADDVRAVLHDNTDQVLSLAQILQGGTWSCGRRLALKRDPQGSPPLRIQSDGTVF